MALDEGLIDFSVLRDTFRVESQENLTEIERAALELEEHPTDPELVETMFRAAHTIKGNARVVGADAVAELTHDFEGLLGALREGKLVPSRDLTTLALKAVDALRSLVARSAEGATQLEPAQEALRTELRNVVAEAPHDEPPNTQENAGPDSAAEATGVPTRCRPAQASTIRVPVDRLDQLMDLVGEIAVARSRLTDMLESGAGHERAALIESHREADRVYMDLQELVMKMRMVPLGPLFHEYHRTVRDLSVTCGNSVGLSLQGEDVEVDTSVVEHLRDPLTHLVRNAVSHGIEPWSRRVVAGKPAQGEVTISAARDAGSIVIRVSDDGAGIDRERILARGIETGLVAHGSELGEDELLRLVLEPGFSTADEVTEIAGRGVGLDVVRRNVEQLRGSVTIESQPGEGTAITLRFPLTLAIIGGFRLSVGAETYVVPLGSVVECIELPPGDRAPDAPFGVTQLRGKPLPFLNLRVLFGLDSQPPEREHLVVVRQGGLEAGLAGDRLLGDAQVVIKPVGQLFQNIPGLAATAILGNGRVAFVLDVSSLLKHAMRLQDELSKRQEATAPLAGGRRSDWRQQLVRTEQEKGEA